MTFSLNTTPLSYSPFCVLSSNHRHKAIFVLPSKALNKECFLLDGALALTFFLLTFLYLLMKRIMDSFVTQWYSNTAILISFSIFSSMSTSLLTETSLSFSFYPYRLFFNVSLYTHYSNKGATHSSKSCEGTVESTFRMALYLGSDRRAGAAFWVLLRKRVCEWARELYRSAQKVTHNNSSGTEPKQRNANPRMR